MVVIAKLNNLDCRTLNGQQGQILGQRGSPSLYDGALDGGVPEKYGVSGNRSISFPVPQPDKVKIPTFSVGKSQAPRPGPGAVGARRGPQTGLRCVPAVPGRPPAVVRAVPHGRRVDVGRSRGHRALRHDGRLEVRPRSRLRRHRAVLRAGRQRHDLASRAAVASSRPLSWRPFTAELSGRPASVASARRGRSGRHACWGSLPPR